jgi:hypothetical protein
MNSRVSFHALGVTPAVVGINLRLWEECNMYPNIEQNTRRDPQPPLGKVFEAGNRLQIVYCRARASAALAFRLRR